MSNKVVPVVLEFDLRDLFAAAALSGLSQRTFVGVGYGTSERLQNDALAVAAYRLADAMLAVRGKQ